MLRPIEYTGGALRILDQTLLPGEECYRNLATVADVAEAIRQLRVRGAPLIGITAAFGVALSAGRPAAGLREVLAACDELESTRPTAVNLPWAMGRMRRVAHATATASGGLSPRPCSGRPRPSGTRTGKCASASARPDYRSFPTGRPS